MDGRLHQESHGNRHSDNGQESARILEGTTDTASSADKDTSWGPPLLLLEAGDTPTEDVVAAHVGKTTTTFIR